MRVVSVARVARRQTLIGGDRLAEVRYLSRERPSFVVRSDFRAGDMVDSMHVLMQSDLNGEWMSRARDTCP